MKRSIKIKKIYNWLIKGKYFLQIGFQKSYEWLILLFEKFIFRSGTEFWCILLCNLSDAW